MRSPLLVSTLSILLMAARGSSSGSSASESPWQQLRDRPLNLPMMSGVACQVTSHAADKDLDASFQGLYGSGPVYPGGAGLSNGHIAAKQLVKMIWTATPAYAGPIVIRGHQLDGAEKVYMSARSWWTGPELKDVEVNSGLQGAGQKALTVGGTALYTELDLPAAGASPPYEPVGAFLPAGGHTRDWFVELFVSKQGCYAWQVDGLGFSQPIIFQASERLN